jgi:2-methylcitrate dehydratase PrpD
VGWKYVPQGLTSAQLNLPYCVATLLLEGDCFVDQFTEDKVADPERMRIADKIEVRHDAEITALGSKFRHKVRLVCQLKDGTRMEQTVEAGRGNEKNFASQADVVSKFEKLAGKVLPAERVGRICEWILGMQDRSDASELVALLSTR